MQTLWRRAALYFGLRDECDEERAARLRAPAPSLLRLVVATVTATLIVGVGGGLVFGDLRQWLTLALGGERSASGSSSPTGGVIGASAKDERDAYRRPFALVHDDAERRLLERRLEELGGPATAAP